VEYLRVLHLAASTMESAVEAALARLLAEGVAPEAERVKAMVAPDEPELPELEPAVVDLLEYDALLACSQEVGA
jgi:hypothetical protein